MVVGDGSKFDNAYFEISYLRAYTTGGIVPTVTPNLGVAFEAVPTFTTTITAANTTMTATFASRSALVPSDPSASSFEVASTGASSLVSTTSASASSTTPSSGAHTNAEGTWWAAGLGMITIWTMMTVTAMR
jgi:hypothetical protein